MVEAGAFHASWVPTSAFVATLFRFDSRRGFERDAGVLGPLEGGPYTQRRQIVGQTVPELVASVVQFRR